MVPIPEGQVEKASEQGRDLKLYAAESHGCWDIYLSLLQWCLTATYSDGPGAVRVFTSPFHCPPQCKHSYPVTTGIMPLVTILCPYRLHDHQHKCKWRICVPEPESSVFKLNKVLIMPFLPRLANGWGINNTIPKTSQKITCPADTHSYSSLEVGKIIMSNASPKAIDPPPQISGDPWTASSSISIYFQPCQRLWRQGLVDIITLKQVVPAPANTWEHMSCSTTPTRN